MLSIFCLNVDVITSLLIDWLDVKDLCYFDSAILNKKNRKLLLSIMNKDFFVLEGLENSLTNHYYEWLIKRNISIRKLTVTADNSLDLVKKVIKNTKLIYLNVNMFTFSISTEYINEISYNLSNLITIDLGYCISMNDYSLSCLVEYIHNVENINLSNCYNLSKLYFYLYI
jgi:hypothetical protein